MLTTANPFDAMAILDGIRWVESETPTEAPGQVNRLASMVVDGYRDLPVEIERIDGSYGCGDHLEEIGSPTSRTLIEAEGGKAKYVLVTEPARDGGKIVTGRKGVARFEIFVKSVPAHSGTRPEDGRSAIRELASLIQTLEGLNDPERGVAVNVGVVRGGTRPNVIPEEAYAEVDMRVPTRADADEIIPKILNLQSQTLR
jgi:hypothetical protein